MYKKHRTIKLCLCIRALNYNVILRVLCPLPRDAYFKNLPLSLTFWNFKRKWGISSLSFQHPEAIYVCMYSHIHISGLAERDVVSCIKAIPSLRSRPLTGSTSSPHLFLHQGPVLWKTIFHCLRVGGGLGVIHVHYIYFYYSYYCLRSSRIGSQRLGDPDLDLTASPSQVAHFVPTGPFCTDQVCGPS